MQPVLTVAEMQAVDALAAETTALDVLVGRAGTAVARAALEIMGGAYGRRAVVICGRGNNGADGRVAARLLAHRGVRTRIVAPGDLDAIEGTDPATDLVIDAAYGTGFHGHYDAPANPSGVPVLAVDIPSGVAGDSGDVSGRVLRATRTVTFVALKPGLLQGDGARLCGHLEVVDIGLPVAAHVIDLVEDRDVAAWLTPRDAGGNKWDAAVLVVAGSPGMTGAAGLCAGAAYRAGSGMVRLGVPGGALGDLPATEAVGVELGAGVWAPDAVQVADRCGAVVVGPGLGRSDGTGAQVRHLLAGSPVPVVVDADGLSVLGRIDRDPPVAEVPLVLTPHDGEYERLAGTPPGPDRVAAVRRLAASSGTVVLLKGPTTTVADPAGRVLVARTGTPALATAGTGDVLSGVIGAFLARGVPALEAAALGAHVHGLAGRRGHRSGLVAGDLPELVAAVLDSLT